MDPLATGEADLTGLLRALCQQCEADGAWLMQPGMAGPGSAFGSIDRQQAASLAEHCAVVSAPKTVVVAGLSYIVMPIAESGSELQSVLALHFPSPLLPAPLPLIVAAGQGILRAELRTRALHVTRASLDQFRHLYEVGQRIASTLDLEQILRESTSRITEVLGAESSTLMLVDETHGELVFSIPAGPAMELLREQRMPLDKGVVGWAVSHRTPVIISDPANDPRFYSAVDQMTGYRTKSILAVPLIVQGRVVGVVEVINKLASDTFSAQDQQWLSILAPLVAAAIENARLFTEEQQRVVELRAANAVAAALNESLELPEMLQSALTTAMSALHAEAGEIRLLNARGTEYFFAVHSGSLAGERGEPDLTPDLLSTWVVAQRHAVVLEDISSDPRAGRLVAQFGRVSAFASVPLLVRDRPTGILTITSSKPATFGKVQLPLLETLGRQVGMAVENARLYVALREERDRIVAAEEKVRHELARNLHDGPAQILSAIILNVDMARRYLGSAPDKMAKELNFLESLAQEANQEVRDLLFNLRPLTLETHGLTAALSQLADRLRQHVEFQLEFDYSGLTSDHIDPPVSGTLFVIIQEALNNIQKHAHAQQVWMRVGETSQTLWVEVKDDGVGFDVRQTQERYSQLNSFGLLNMRERAHLIDGLVEITSPLPDGHSGTLVRVEVPLSRARPWPTTTGRAVNTGVSSIKG
jgi:signal transduction histidine kinase